MCHPEVPAGQPIPDVAKEEVTVPLPGGHEMPAVLVRPEGGSAPAVLVVSDVFGRSPFYENLACRLAMAGFAALCPEYFFREGPLEQPTREAALARRQRLDEGRAVRELDATIDWLGALDGVIGDRVGTVGFCMGGTFVLDLAAMRSDLVTVSYYGFPVGRPGPASAPVPLEVADRMSGPILGFWGDQDEAVGMDNVEKLAAALRERDVDFQYTIYPGVGHGFMARSGLEEGKEGYEEACDSWARAIHFYRQHLSPVPTRRTP